MTETATEKLDGLTPKVTWNAEGNKAMPVDINGEEYLAAPMVVINTKDNSVMNGTLYPPNAIRADEWNHCGLTVNHPQSITSNAAVKIGFTDQAKYNQKNGRLEMIAYISKKSCEGKGGAGIYEKIKAGESMDVSCAVYINEWQNKKGEVNGATYNIVATKIEPVAVGLMENEDGACPRPNCGVNKQEEKAVGILAEAMQTINRIFINKQEDKSMSEQCNCQTNGNQSMTPEAFAEALNKALGEGGAIEKAVNAAIEKREQNEAAKAQAAKAQKEEISKTMINLLKENKLIKDDGKESEQVVLGVGKVEAKEDK